MPPLLLKLVFDAVVKAPMPFFVKPIAGGISAKVLSSFVMPNIVRQLDFMEAATLTPARQIGRAHV